MSFQKNPHNLDNWKQLLKLGEHFLNQDTFDAQKAIILDTSKKLLNCNVDLYFLDIIGDQERLNNEGYHPSLLMQTALERRQTVVSSAITDVSTPNNRKRRKSPSLKTKAESEQALVVASPLIFHDTSLGVLQLSRPEGPAFSQEELELVEGLAAQSAIAIQASRQITSERRQFKLLSLVQSVSAQIAELLDLDELTRQITRLIQETFDFYYVAIFTVERGQEKLRFWHSARHAKTNHALEIQSNNGLKSQEFIFDVRLGQGIIGYVAQNGEEIIANDVSQNPHYRAVDTLPETHSEAALPLKIENRTLGVLDVQSYKENAFRETEVLVLRALADNIATAVENARLYSDVNRRAEHLGVVTEVSNAITSILELDELLNEVVRLVHLRLGYPFVRIYSVHTGRRRIFFRAGINPVGIVEPSDEFTIDLDDKDSLIALVACEGKTKIVAETIESQTPLAEGIQSQLIVPLKFSDEVLGVLEIQSHRKKAFDLDDQSLLEALADYIAIAMRNANLFRSEMWRRQVADSMREVAGLLTADAALDQVLDLILKELERTLPCDVAAIWLSDTDDNNPSMAKLKLAAVRLTQEFNRYNSANENSLSTAEIFQLLSRTTVPSPWLLDALYSAHPKVRYGNEAYEPLGAILDFPADYSAIAAPLKLAGQPLGLLVLVHHTDGRYGHEAQSMTETFASYAAVAIENTRLYEAAHDQAWVSTVLLQVAEATQTLNTLDELLSTMVRITPMLIGVNSCSFFLWDSSSDMFFLAATYGLSEELNLSDDSIRISLGEIPVFDQLLLAKGPVVVNGSDINIVFPTLDINDKSLVLFPMISHGEVVGALMVDYTTTLESSQSEKYVEEVGWDERFAIIQGIAHQTAIAVENIHLVKAQQDEAYVSVALLQVAQAVVSLNALDEILEAIVRITPILVGVKRSLIFVRNINNEVFHLSQSYGLSRGELLALGEDFLPHEFPILEAVQNSNSIVFHSISTETDSPLNWKHIDHDNFDILEQDFHALFGLEKPDPHSETYLGKDHLKSQASLLYGFPLTVKGTVLGVMITQEMELTSGYPSRRIREKRLEISIGITQQAAIAIQNDRLQKEVVERERLEREFQLARDIQETFLPDSLPEHPGWDLTSLWRPARQVSGDFYDVIELPQKQWGLVIADVADKGMPAALYMTLIRSLIRAAVKDEFTPASVLRRVNDLLVADSKRGMFVTIVYAVLSLEDGVLLYANAGHNPPFLVRGSSQTLEKLAGTAMALGVFEGIKVGQKKVQLQKGDSLILYTDGITEAFSPDEIMFGEGRLVEVIKGVDTSSAERISSSIDQAVIGFTEGDTSSDDITLVVLKRENGENSTA